MDVPRADGDSVRVWVMPTDMTTLCCVSERDSDCGASREEDGDSVRVWVRATERDGQHEKTDSVLVHVDSSPPVHPGRLAVSTRPHSARRAPLH